MKKNRLPISIIIPVADDLRVGKCIESIDEEVEIVVVLNGATSEVKNLIKNYKVKTCFLQERNLSAALNAGIKCATFDNVLFMDSDCTFRKGTIMLLYNGLQGFKLAKGKVIFESTNLWNRIFARAREYTTSDKLSAYKPPLAMKKSIIKDIGYYFDEDIHWTEDADLDRRVKEKRISIHFIPEAIIYHPPVTLFGDLRSAFRYGIGKRIRKEKGKTKGLGTFFFSTFDIIKKKGILTALYMLFWNLSYCAGYFYQFLFDPYKVREKLKCQKTF
jgi:glycosyltransferase involved in cell wall biosynthesis